MPFVIPNRARIELATNVASERVTFQVRDSGPGISASDQKLIFQPFMRLNPESTSGAGLGLTITRQLVEAMGDQLRIDSEPGQGSTFSFSLPLNTGNEALSSPGLDGVKVLLVDDDADVLAIYQLYLQDWGMRVSCSTDLPHALELIEQQLFDLVLTDLHLAEENGIELLKVVRTQQKACKTILCSGAGISAEWQQSIGEFADKFLLKPVGPAQLQAAISDILGQVE